MQEIIAKLKEFTKDKYLKYELISYLNLLLLVDLNYASIDQLETLGKLFEGGLNSYYKEHLKKQEEMVVLCGELTTIVFNNHYERDPEQKIDIKNLFLEIIEKESYVKSLK